MAMAVQVASTLDDVKALVNDAIAARQHLEVVGSGSKRGLGRTGNYHATIDVSGMAGIVDYQPEELVLTLRAGTPMSVVEAALAKAHQMLAFEVPDYSHLLGTGSAGTIGGVIAGNLSGPRRLTKGAARDYLLGFEAVSGRGELFKSGGKVMKNVTGYDLSKLITGSFGTLAVMDEITLKTLPKPETSCSLIGQAADFADATKQIASVFATPHEPGASAILPCSLAAAVGLPTGTGDACTYVIRLEGIAISIADRAAHLIAMTGGQTIEQTPSEALWADIRDVTLLDKKLGQDLGKCQDKKNIHDVWKISVPPADAAGVIGKISTNNDDITYFADWGGGLIWMTGGSAGLGQDIRNAVAERDSGFAMLIRDAGTASIPLPPLQPLNAPLLSLHKRVKAAFDPLGVLNFGRMHEDV